MIFDTDVIIWVQRGDSKASALIEPENERFISVQTYMELLQTAPDRKYHDRVKLLLTDLNFHILPLSEAIGHRASVYIEEYTLSSGLRSDDALIAATAVENDQVLATGNAKHFRPIRELKLKAFHR